MPDERDIEQQAERHECICISDCYIDHERNKHVHYMRGQIEYFWECPPHFVLTDASLRTSDADTEYVDEDAGTHGELFTFEDATEEILMATDFDLSELKAFCAEKYGVSIHPNTQKPSSVAQFVHARDNYVMGLNVGEVI